MSSVTTTLGAAPAAPRRGRSMWPWLVVGLLAIPVTVDVGVIWFVGSDPTFAVEPQYYQKAINWDDEMAQRRANDALGWTTRVEVFPGADGPTLRVHVLDREGQPVTGAQVSAETFHNARASQVLTATLQGDGDGYSAALAMQRPGLWEVRLAVQRGKDHFTRVERLELVGGRA